MKNRIVFIILTLVFIIETTLIPHVRILDVTANLLFCFMIIFVYLYDKVSCIISGTVFALMRDIVIEPVSGIGALNIFGVALLIYFIRGFFNRENLATVLLFSVAGTAVYNLGYWILLKVAGYNSSFLFMLSKLLVMIILNTITVTILYFIFIRKITRYRKDDKFMGGYSPYKMILKK